MTIEVPKSIDINVPNSESVQRISKSSKNGGVQSAVMMPTIKPIFDKLHLAYNLKRANESKFKLLVAIEGIHEGKLTDISILKDKGASAIYINSDEDMNLLKRVFEYAEFLNIPIFVNCNNKSLSSGIMHDSEIAYSLGVSGIPTYAESAEVAKIYELSKHFNAKVVFQSITTKDSIQILKNKPKNIFIDVCIDNLYFCDENLQDFNSLYKTFPPLRSKEDKEALLEACASETVDFISSNHIATTHKDVPLEEAEFGISKLDIFTQLAYSLPLSQKTVTKLISQNPAKLFNIKIKETLILKKGDYDVDISKFESKGKNCPYKKLSFQIV
ncbi:putative dihydroorotase [Nautilia profundicola AmH]|uniref:Dihydroorotase n=1 Tax=Nautilia profundicola (strain ATCC BAA-1463 / DSM 18972 / AmH) TaxID=598659 RepID=B9L9E4_NAUPA|nr:dihydroorotase [Nautilia profundicola]ACM92234.1 putative dihydroorotase [Nautilia profundicola AmH]